MGITKGKKRVSAARKRAQKRKRVKRAEIELEVLCRLMDQHIQKIETADQKIENSISSKITTRTMSIKNSLQGLVLNETARSEIAIAVAEISPDMERMLALIEKCGKEKLSREDLIALLTIATHWPQHLRDLKRNLLRALEEIS